MRFRIASFMRRIDCAVWGHAVDNRTAGLGAEASRRCRCGADYLRENGSATHMRHTLSCFLSHHTYVRLAERDGVHEYVCIRCGHPLVFPRDADRFDGREIFGKRVRYLCGLFGHRVRAVTSRNGFLEYACHCGHSFLKTERADATIRHPLICVVKAHRVRHLENRGGYAEFVCLDCGHAFCFSEAPLAPGSRRATQVVMQR
jgi:DNA-directed RNA polymerase subunit RPC12/RpoP